MATPRILQNHLLFWVDNNIVESQEVIQHTLQQLRAVINHVTLFGQIGRCLRFLQQVKKEQVLIITSGALGRCMVRRINDMPQVEAIFILCDNVGQEQSWSSQWSKVRGVYDHIQPICDALRVVVRQSNENLMPISFSKQMENKAENEDSNLALNRLEPSFIYTCVFKRIFLKMAHEPDEEQVIVKLCRSQYAYIPEEMAIVEEFDLHYRPQKAIWWYTRECFIYQILNRALRLLEFDTVVDLGFFIHDLHWQLEKLHREQFDDYRGSPLTVYRRQRMSTADFDKLKKNCRGLIAFNNFLSTSETKPVLSEFVSHKAMEENVVGASSGATKWSVTGAEPPELVEEHTLTMPENYPEWGSANFWAGLRIALQTVIPYFGEAVSSATSSASPSVDVVFVITADPTISGAIFANIEKHSYYHKEKEVCFSMCSVFRVGEVISLGAEQRQFEVRLTLTSDDDPELRGLTDRLEEDIETDTDRKRLGRLLIHVGEFVKAIEFYSPSLGQEPSAQDQALYYHDLGAIKNEQGNYKEAVRCYEQAISIREKMLLAPDLILACSYGGIGLVYMNMGEYSLAMFYHNKALAVQEKILPKNHSLLAVTYNNIGLLYQHMIEYSKALFYYEKALAMKEEILPIDDPSLAISYNNIGFVYDQLGDQSQALSYYAKALAIKEKTLPADHPSLATSYNNIGLICWEADESSLALFYHKKALAVREKNFPANHPDIAQSYNNIGTVYDDMRELDQALSYLQKAVFIREKVLPANHPSLAITYYNIGRVYDHLKDYSNALRYFEQAYEIRKRIFPPWDNRILIALSSLEEVKRKL